MISRREQLVLLDYSAKSNGQTRKRAKERQRRTEGGRQVTERGKDRQETVRIKHFRLVTGEIEISQLYRAD